MINDDWEAYSEECSYCGKSFLRYQLEKINPYWICSSCFAEQEREREEQEREEEYYD
jgi:formylmethanofuran dehydrogenase subunit E